MKLREHPFLSTKWPPAWTWIGGEANKNLAGEQGALVKVMVSLVSANQCYMIVDYNQSEYMGHLTFDSAETCLRIYSLLQNYVGASVSVIGNLDLSQFF
jgi:hypothetical protein